jgi:hypothetical protein
LEHDVYYRVVATNDGGVAWGTEMVFQTATVVTPPTIGACELLGNGQFRLRFTSPPARASACWSPPALANWTPLGPATEMIPGQFEFADADAPNHSQRFYRLRSL